MGGKQSHSFDENQFNSLWERRQTTGEGRNLWRNKSDPTKQIEQYPIYANTDDQIEREQTLYDLRKNSSDLVAATHLKQTKKGGLCSNSAQGRLFLQRIPLKLQALQHIPFPDILHLNVNALSGYKKLVKAVGPFRPQEQQIGFNSQGVAKVWLNGEYSLSKPASVEQSQAAMVRNILQLIDDNSDRNTTPLQNPSIMNYVYRQNNDVSFDQAITAVNQYAQRYNNGVVPSSLQCIKRVGIDHISKSLTTMRENGVVTSLNTVPRTSFTHVQVQHPVYTSTTTTSNIAPVKTTIVNAPIQQRVITTGSAFVPLPTTVTTTFVPPSQITGSKVLTPVQTLVKRSSVVNFNTVGSPVSQIPVQKIVSQVPVQQVITQVPVSQSQVQQTIRPPIQQIIRQGASQNNVVFGNKSIIVPVQQQQRVIVTQSLPQNPVVLSNISQPQNPVVLSNISQPQNSVIVSNIPQQQVVGQSITQVVSQPQQIVAQPQQVVVQQVVVPQQQQKVVPQQQVVILQQTQNIQQKQFSRNVEREQQVEVRQHTQTRNEVIQSATTGAFLDNKTYGISSSQQQDNLNLNYIQSTSSRFRDVSLQDGKSSSALLAELRTLSTKVYTPDTTSNNTYKSYQNYDDSNNYSYKSSNNYTTQVNDTSNEYSGNYNNQAGYYGMFNKYSTGHQDNLQNNLQMKYSMTQDQYENQQYQQQYENQQYQQQYQNEYNQQQYQNEYNQQQYQNQQYENEQYHNQYQQQYQNQGQYNVDYDPQILADIQRMRN